MESFCSSDLWDLRKSWNSTTPDFTPCFHKTVLVWVPCAFLWIASPYEIYRIRTTELQAKRIPWTLVAIWKMLLVLILAILSSLELVNALVNLSDRYPADYYSPFIALITLCYASLLIILNRKKAINSSAILFLFWLLLTISSILTYRSIFTDLLDPDSLSWKIFSLTFITQVVATPLILALFVLSCFSDSYASSYGSGKVFKNPSPEWSAAFPSRLAFWWMNSLIFLGYKRPLTQADAFNLSKENSSSDVFEKYREHWSYEKNPTITWPLFLTFWPQVLGAASLKFVSSILTFVRPVLLDYILTWLASDAPYWQGFFFAVMMFVSSFVESMLNTQHEYLNMQVAIRMKTAVCDALYRKSLKLSPSAKNGVTTGEVMNLLTVDTERIIEYASFANYWWIAPLQIGISLYLLWAQLGIATIAGVVVLLLLMPANGFLSNKWEASITALMTEKDVRSKLMNEVLNGIKILKMYGWEESFNNQIKAVREREVSNLKTTLYYLSFFSFTFDCASIFVALASFATFVLVDEKNVLDASKAFVSLSLFNLIKLPLVMLPFLVTFNGMFQVSKRRLDEFLNKEEFNLDEISRDYDSVNALTISNGNFSWTKDEADVTLRDINVDTKRGKLIAVVGAVGSGKSSLLSALLGEMNKLDGTVNISGSLAYVPQQAWIQNATVKQNIIFTSNMNEAKYQSIVEACALAPDLQILPAGDNTEIGERGINLSGGQKQRVSLARAVYADCNIYLLDDPLSAVDSHVGKHLFDQVIGPNGMLQGKTRILVTHRIALLPQVDEIIVMKDCRVNEKGTYQELVAQKGAFAEFLLEYLAAVRDGEDEALDEIKSIVGSDLERRFSVLSNESSDHSSSDVVRKRLVSTSESRTSQRNTLLGRSTSVVSQKVINKEIERNVDAGKLIDEETAETGAIKLSVYVEYMRAIGIYSSLAILVTYIASSCFNIGSSLWLSIWSNDSLYPERSSDTGLRNLRLSVYGVLGFSESIFVFLSQLVLYLGALNASKKLHNKMLSHILRAPMSFFDTTPLGRILNRFTKDVDSNDVNIRENLVMFVQSFFGSLATILVISFQTPYFVIPIIPLSVGYYYIQRYYIATSRQLRRLDSNSKSPIYSHFTETVNGASSIRAFGAVSIFSQQCEQKLDVNNQCYILNLASTYWLAVRIEMLGNIIALLAALFAVWSKGSIEPSNAGLSISYALSATSPLNYLVRAIANLENDLVAVERCIQYTKTPVEAAFEIEETKPDPNWPHEGVVRFENYSTRYRDGLDLVLNGVNFEVTSRQKIGIVGRTGAGKSSLTVALFRIVESAGGSIVIDGVDISKIGLNDLRSRLTIIPQDLVLFTGSIRLNLDPFDSYNDQELWMSLKLAHLEPFVKTLNAGLAHQISEGGENLSVGQRQLICLARALLRRPKILVLDEATAAVDLETDDLVQKTIRTEFADCTILTIAHRLNTILDYDKVLVMDAGKVAEYDTPKLLLDNPLSIFHSMAKDAGLLAASSGQSYETG